MSNLSADLTTFIGRQQDMPSVKKLFSSTRLITLVGVGGVGKTRLAVRIGRDLQRAFPQGVWMVDLAPVRGDDPDQVALAVAGSLGFSVPGGQSPVAALADHLSGWHALLILDNCEHLVDAAAEVTGVLLRRCEQLHILATSRQPLRIAGEFTFAVPPLPVPDPELPAPALATLESYDSVRLFLDRAKAVVPGFALSEDDCAAVAGLVQRLDGIPLLLELAAARVRLLSPRQILERLAEPYRVLSAPVRSGPARHHSVRALVEWSLDLCSEEERRLWAQLAVFPRDFDADAAEYIMSGDGISPATVLELLAGLVDQSLVVPQPHPRQVRYAIPQALREYAAERLPDVSDRAVLRQRHLDCYLRIADQMSGEWFGERQAEWSQRLRDERLNLTAALEHALAEGEVESCLALLHALSITSFTSGSFAEGRRCLDMLLASETGPTAARTQALWLKALIDGYSGDAIATGDASQECKVLAEQLGDDRMLSNAIEQLGVTSLLSEGPRSATDHFEESLALARRTDDSSRVALKLVRWGQCQLLLGETAQAQRLLEEAEGMCRDSGENWYRGYALWGLAIASSRAGDTGRAMELARSSLRLSQGVGNSLGISQALEVLASILAGGSSSERAAELLGAGAEVRDKVGGSVVPLLAPLNEATRHKLIRVLGDRRFAAAYAHGQAYSTSDALAIALSEHKRAEPEAGGGSQILTKREREVVNLVAEGLSNKEIAGTLVISRRTVEGHVENVMTKFGYRSRAQIAAWVAGERRREAAVLADMDRISPGQRPR